MMTMWPRSGRAVPASTARVAFPKGCLAIRIRDALGALFEDAQFTELFATRGRPAVSPARPDRGISVAVRRRPDGPPGRRRGPRPHRLEVRPGLGACRHRV